MEPHTRSFFFLTDRPHCRSNRPFASEAPPAPDTTAETRASRPLTHPAPLANLTPAPRVVQMSEPTNTRDMSFFLAPTTAHAILLRGGA